MSDKKKEKSSSWNEGWLQVITIVGSNLLIILTFFGMTITLYGGIRQEIQAIQTEIKDFHGRLCDLEARRK